MRISRRPAFVFLGLCVAAIGTTLSGCTVARAMAGSDPGVLPRDGQLREVAGVGTEQVRFAFRFKAGSDPEMRRMRESGDGTAGPGTTSLASIAARIAAARLNDTEGRVFSIIDQEVLRDGNVYTVVLTSAAVARKTYEVICQVRLTIGGYQVKLGATAFRELGLWRAAPRSFRFTVYGADQTVPWWERGNLSRVQ